MKTDNIGSYIYESVTHIQKLIEHVNAACRCSKFSMSFIMSQEKLTGLHFLNIEISPLNTFTRRSLSVMVSDIAVFGNQSFINLNLLEYLIAYFINKFLRLFL